MSSVPLPRLESADTDVAVSRHPGVVLVLRFPGRRYHATPWEHHVNEGQVEWPPSPFRLLRALLATGYTKLRWPGSSPPPVARSLIEKLASVLPRYCLPHAVGTHTRHYLPLARFKNAREETALVLDTWAQIDDGTIGVRWEVELNSEELALLGELVRQLGYLGRAESWVEGELLSTDAIDRSFDVHAEAAAPGRGWEQVSLFAPLSPAEYATWREHAVGAAMARLPTANAKGKPLTSAQRSSQIREVQEAHPPDLVACLQVSTGWLNELGWSQPPGTRRVFYWRQSTSLEFAAARPRVQHVKRPSVNFMLLSIATATGNASALPLTKRALPQAELLHRALLSCAGDRPPRALSGRDEQGQPLAGEEAHRHAHLLHLDLDQDGHLDHVLIWAPMGLDAEAQSAVRAVRNTFAKGVKAALRLSVAAAGSARDLVALHPPLKDGLRAVLGSGTTGSNRWRSLTPFVPPRYLKRSGRNALEGQIVAELKSRDLPELSSLQIHDPRSNDEARQYRHFVRSRRFGRSPPVDIGFMLDLTLAEPRQGPIALGYGCHFGLGLFQAIPE